MLKPKNKSVKQFDIKNKSSKQFDVNGWWQINDNPLSKAGVFPYLGSTIDPNGEFDLDPNKIYNVLRPAEELSDPDTIESFKLVPWIDGHVMLGGSDEDLTPVDKKGISGVIGENVFFDTKDQMLKGNVKLFSEKLDDSIEAGKKELSLGYRCKYKKRSGLYDGKSYDFVQTEIRGNHMASVDKGRMGSDVAVLDSKSGDIDLFTFTIDSKEFEKMKMTAEEMEEALLKLTEIVTDLVEKVKNLTEAEETEAEDKDKAETEDKETEAEDKETEDKETETETEAEDKDTGVTMDSLMADNKSLKKMVSDLTSTVENMTKNGIKTFTSELNKRDNLALQLSNHIGTFDHSEMTLDEVAAYGVEKLEIQCEKGSELAVLNGYLHNRNAATPAGHTMDSKSETMDDLNSYIEGEK